MPTRRERSDVDGQAHRVVAGVIGMEIVPRQLRELAVGQIRRSHVARGRIEFRLVEIHDSVEEPGSADVLIDLSAVAIDDRAIVRAKITTKNGTDVPVESRVLLKGNRWLIYDILIENLSLISNYRAQFDRVIRTASYDELVKRLKTKGEFLNEKGTKAPRKGAAGKN